MVPDRWLVLEVRVPSEEYVELLSEELLALGGAAVEENLDLLITYILPPQDPEGFVREAYDRLRALVPGRELEMLWRWQESEDWAEQWRRGLRPRRVGPRLVVSPSWAEPELGPGDILLVIDPEMAFGTGEHATTRGALRLLQAALRPGDRVVDVGTGSAILAIAAARLGAGEVQGVESDPDALINARDNVERNGVAERVELLEALVDDEFLEQRGAGRYELILANVLSGVIRPLLPAFRRALSERAGRPGRLIVGGILEQEAEAVIEDAEAAGFRLVVEDLEEEWWGGLFEVTVPAPGAP